MLFIIDNTYINSNMNINTDTIKKIYDISCHSIIQKYIDYAKKEINNKFPEIRFVVKDLLQKLKHQNIRDFTNSLDYFHFIYCKYIDKNYVVINNKLDCLKKIIKTQISIDINQMETKINDIYKLNKLEGIRFIMKNISYFRKKPFSWLLIKKCYNDDIYNTVYIFIIEYKKYAISKISSPEKKCSLYFNIDEEAIKDDLQEKKISNNVISAVKYLVNITKSSAINIKNNFLEQLHELYKCNIDDINNTTLIDSNTDTKINTISILSMQ